MENKDNENLETDKVRKSIINWSSYISLLLWFILIWFIAYLMIYKDFKWDDLSNLYIIVWILFLFWFLWNEFVDIFKNTIKNKIEEKVNKYLEDNQSIIDDKIWKQLYSNVDEILESKFEKLDEDNSDISNIDEIDDLTVIVASWWSIDWNIKNKAYFHPKKRKFREWTKYLWYYYKWIVKWYWKIKKLDKIDNKDELNKLVKSANDSWYDININDHDFFSTKSWFEESNINWNSLWRTPVMSKQYISLSKLFETKKLKK